MKMTHSFTPLLKDRRPGRDAHVWILISVSLSPITRTNLRSPLPSLGVYSTQPKSFKIDQSRSKSIKFDQKTIKNNQTNRWGFDPREERVQWTLQSKNSAGNLRPFIVGAYIPKGECNDSQAGQCEEDGGCSFIRVSWASIKPSLARPLTTSLPSFSSPSWGCLG